MEDQTSAMLCLIEDHLIENGTVFGKKQFDLPDEDSDIEEDEYEDDEDEDLEDSELTPEYL